MPHHTLSAVAFLTAAILGPAPMASAQDASPLASGSEAVTFSKHIAPIVFQNCTSCHRPGEGAPFPLMTYTHVKRRARMIGRVIKERIMPPWQPVPGHGRFVGEMRLTNEQIELIQTWIANGRPEGDPADLPPMPAFTKGWQLGKPDLVVKMPKGYTVPAGGPDIYRNFVIPLDIPEDKWITAIEVRPSARAVLHHVLFDFDTSKRARQRDGQDGQPGFRGMGGGRDVGMSTSGLGGWAVGGQPRHLPMGLARRLPKGADIILRSHFHPSGKEEVEQTTLGIHLTDKKPTRTMVGLQMPPMFGIAAGLNVPPGEANFKLKDSYKLRVPAQVLTIGGHAHYICREMQVWATFPGKTERESIFWINRWAFNWQNRYQFEEPLDLPAGTEIDVEITYDNSANNPSNPFDPPRRIRWGQQSTDEMGSVTLLLVPKHERHAQRLTSDIKRKAQRKMRSQFSTGGNIQNLLLSSIRMMDKNGDGKIAADEIPSRFRRVVERYDTNKDGVLDNDELEAMANGEVGRRR